MPRKKTPKFQEPRATGLTAQDVRDLMTEQFGHFLSDIEWRVAQAYEVARRGTQEVAAGILTAGDRVFAEDLNINHHVITGYTVTANTPAGHITWSNLHVVYGGIDYNVANGNSTTTGYYMWLDLSTATTVDATNKNITMSQSPIGTKPALETGDVIVFLNQSGVPVSLLEQNIANVIGNNAVDTLSIQNNAVSGAKIGTNALGTGITGANITNGAVGSLQVGTGVNGLSGGNLQNGAVGNLQVGVGAISATRLNVLDHVIY